MNEEPLYFDLFVELTDLTISFFSEKDIQRKIDLAYSIDSLRETMMIAPGELLNATEPPQALRYIRKQQAQTNPYVITPPVLKMALEMEEKAGRTPVPYEPWLKLPFLIEFEGAAIGDANNRFVVIWAFRDWDDPNIIQVQFFTPGMQQGKNMFWNYETGDWEFEQMGTCDTTSCELSRLTVEGENYRMRKSDTQWMDRGCVCARAGYDLAQLVNIFNHILRHRKEPLVYEDITRYIPKPHSQQGRLTKKQKIENAKARERSKPNVVIVSLSAPVQVHQSKPKAKTEAPTEADHGLDVEKIPVEGYYKVLIPGEGKPWKQMHLIQVASYERRQHPAALRTRYKVIE